MNVNGRCVNAGRTLNREDLAIAVLGEKHLQGACGLECVPALRQDDADSEVLGPPFLGAAAGAAPSGRVASTGRVPNAGSPRRLSRRRRQARHGGVWRIGAWIRGLLPHRTRGAALLRSLSACMSGGEMHVCMADLAESLHALREAVLPTRSACTCACAALSHRRAQGLR